MKLTTKKAAVVAAGTAVALLGTGSAYAYFTTSATGYSAKGAVVGLPVSLTVTQDTERGITLLPGVEASALKLSIKNTATFKQYVGKVYVTVAHVYDAPTILNGVAAKRAALVILNDSVTPLPGGLVDSKVCSVNNFVTTSSETVGAIAAGATATLKASVAMLETETDQTACKGATVALSFSTVAPIEPIKLPLEIGSISIPNTIGLLASLSNSTL